MAADEQLILSISEDGYGKRSSAFDYRTTNRGGKGIDNMVLVRGGGAPESQVAAAFPVAEGDEIMLVTDGGQIIRCPVDDISKNRRKTRGVVVFRVAEDEHVVSVTCLREEDEAEEGEEGEEGGEAAGPADVSEA